MVDNSEQVLRSEQVFSGWDFPLFIGLTGLKLLALGSGLWCWFTLLEWRDTPVVSGLISGMLCALLLNSQLRWLTLLSMRRPVPKPAAPGWRVAVLTTFVPGAEPLEMLAVTVHALVALEYPHDTWVLDEGDAEPVKALCRQLGAYHFSRKALPQFQTSHGTFQAASKHGNYNAWLHARGIQRYDIVSVFDPDHVPEPTFLTQVLGYFAVPYVGYVQTAQAYDNQAASFIARGAAEEGYTYYSSLQMASYGMGVQRRPEAREYYQLPQLIGSHNTHRVTALKQIGGLAPHDADDLVTTMMYWAYGWQGVYVPRILARGLAPVDWHGYLTQQRRWARAILNVKWHGHPGVPRTLSRSTRWLMLFHGLTYVQHGLLIPTALFLLGLMLATGKAPTILSYPYVLKGAVLFLAFQSVELYRQRFYLDRPRESGLHWRACLLQWAKWPYLIAAVYDVLCRRRLPYILTRKVPGQQPNTLLRRANLGVVGWICLCLGLGMLHGHDSPVFLYLMAVLTLAISGTLLVSASWSFPPPYDAQQQKNKVWPLSRET